MDWETFSSCASAASKTASGVGVSTAGAWIVPTLGWPPRSTTWSMNRLACTSSSSAWRRSQPAIPGRSCTSISMASWR